VKPRAKIVISISSRVYEEVFAWKRESILEVSMAIGSGKIKLIGWMVGSGLVGAGAALLLAPQSGKRTRRDLRYFGKKVLNRSAAIGMDVRHSVDDLIDEVTDQLQEGAQRSFEMASKAGRDVRSAVTSSRSYIRDGVEKLRHAS
jgi:gas vesicle protein